MSSEVIVIAFPHRHGRRAVVESAQATGDNLVIDELPLYLADLIAVLLAEDAVADIDRRLRLAVLERKLPGRPKQSSIVAYADEIRARDIGVVVHLDRRLGAQLQLEEGVTALRVTGDVSPKAYLAWRRQTSRAKKRAVSLRADVSRTLDAISEQLRTGNLPKVAELMFEDRLDPGPLSRSLSPAARGHLIGQLRWHRANYYMQRNLQRHAFREARFAERAFTRINDDNQFVRVQTTKVASYRMIDDLNGALALSDEIAPSLSPRIHDPQIIGEFLLSSIAPALALADDAASVAEVHIQRALPWIEKVSDPVRVGETQIRISQVLLARGKYEGAATTLDACYPVVFASDAPWLEAWWYRHRARAGFELGEEPLVIANWLSLGWAINWERRLNYQLDVLESLIYREGAVRDLLHRDTAMRGQLAYRASHR